MQRTRISSHPQRLRFATGVFVTSCVAGILFALPSGAQVILPPDLPLQSDPQSDPIPPIHASPYRPGAFQQAIPQPPQQALSELLGEATLEPPRSIQLLPPVWPYYLLWSVLSLLLFLALVVWLVRRNRRPKPVPVIPADVRALGALEALIPLIREARAREFSYQASEIIRGYIEDRFALSARNRTTREFLSTCLTAGSSIAEHHHESLRQFLGFCDLAKYARQVLEPRQLDDMYQSAARFIRDTRPSIMAVDTHAAANRSGKERRAS